ncbi:MAG: hypothetical protein COA78_06755 [Blastopirellula sp.]|nr:MAG: hypothetical protein COA78_06755 [Blastopirellula sp.]
MTETEKQALAISRAAIGINSAMPTTKELADRFVNAARIINASLSSFAEVAENFRAASKAMREFRKVAHGANQENKKRQIDYIGRPMESKRR